jgi:hypothetical protein
LCSLGLVWVERSRGGLRVRVRGIHDLPVPHAPHPLDPPARGSEVRGPQPQQPPVPCPIEAQQAPPTVPSDTAVQPPKAMRAPGAPSRVPILGRRPCRRCDPAFRTGVPDFHRRCRHCHLRLGGRPRSKPFTWNPCVVFFWVRILVDSATVPTLCITTVATTGLHGPGPPGGPTGEDRSTPGNNPWEYPWKGTGVCSNGPSALCMGGGTTKRPGPRLTAPLGTRRGLAGPL